MINFSPIKFESETILKYLELFSECFPANAKFNINYLEWLYKKNPCGPALGYDAWDGEKLAAHYVVTPIDIHVDGLNVRGLLSLNTATHPLYQGRGLFTKLAECTYAAAAEQGFQAVFGVANANSTSGFVRKLGFQLVEPLDAKVGIGSLGIDLERVEKLAQFRTRWTKESLEWRCANPNNPVAMRTKDGRFQFYAPAMGLGVHAYSEQISQNGLELGSTTQGHLPKISPIRLYLGLSPTDCKRAHCYVDIPQRFRPSPLNFIYKCLRGVPQKLEPERVSFSFLDFDAY
jgi:GNAT superfamily N-acetyltransferase